MRRRLSTLRLALLTITVLLAAAPAAQAGEAVTGTFGSPGGEGSGELFEPKGIAVNRTGAGGVSPGDVYVVDGRNNRIQEFSATGAFVRAFGYDVVASGPDNTGANEKQSVTADATGGTFALAITRRTFAATTEGSNVISHVYAPTSAFHVGDAVQGAFPAGTTITAVGTGSLVLSAGATATFLQGEFRATETTASVPYDTTPDELEAALEALPSIGSGNVAVTGGPGATAPLTIEYIGALGHNEVVHSKGSPGEQGSAITAVSTALDGATHTATVATTVPGGGYEVCNASGPDVCKAAPDCNRAESSPEACRESSAAGSLNRPSGLAVDQKNGNVYVTDVTNNSEETSSRVDVYSATGAVEGAFGWNVNASSPKEELQFCTSSTGCQAGTQGGGAGQLGESAVSNPAVDPSNGNLYLPDGGNLRLDEFAPTLNGSGEVTGVSFVRALGWDVVESGPDNVSPANAIQQLTIPPTVSGGTFTLTVAGQTTAPLPFKVTSFDLRTAFQGLGSVGGVNGSITAVEKGAGVFELVFGGELEDVPVSQITVDSSKLTGGTATTSVIAVGVSPYEQCNVAAHPTDVCEAGIEGGHLGQFSQGNPTSVAVDSTGAIYAVNQGSTVCSVGVPCRILKFDRSGASSEEFSPARLTGAILNQANAVDATDVAVDPSDDNVLVAKKEGIAGFEFLEFDSSGTLLGQSPGDGDTLGSDVNSSLNHGLAVGADQRFYFVNALGMVDVFGPPPAPSVTIGPVTDVGATTATFHGTVTPPAPIEGAHFDTTYHFEYSTDGLTWSRFPADDVDIGDGSGAGAPNTCPVDNPSTCTVEQAATGLQPGVLYQVRLVATTGSAATSTPAQFETESAAPSILGTVAEEVNQTSAKLVGSVNPNNDTTSYHFEWGTDTKYGARIPIDSDSLVGSGGNAVEVSVNLSGLKVGSVYHFRLVATNSSGTTDGPDQEFFALDEASLPDDRAPEQVSPADKRPVGSIERIVAEQIGTQVALDGNSTLFPVLNGLAGSTAGGNVEYLAARGETGWASTQISPRSLVPTSGTSGPASDQTGYVLYFAPDLSCGFLGSRQPLTADTPGEDVERGISNLYRRNAEGTYTLISAPVPLNNPGTPSAMTYAVNWASPDCSHVLFTTTYQLLPDAGGGGEANLYEWANGDLRLAGVRPDSSVGGHATATRLNSMSPDGSRVFFTATSDEGGDNGKTAVFVREDGQRTIDASQSQTATPNDNDGGSTYQMASADGSHVFFLARYGLAANGTSTGPSSCVPLGGEGCDLYAYDVDTEVLTDLSADANSSDEKGADVAGLVDVSEDGSYAYFAARGQLLAGEGKTEAQNLQGNASYNLYGSHDGQLSYVGLIGKSDMGGDGGSDAVTDPLNWAAAATPDGTRLLFVSHEDVTDYESGGVREAYLYTAGTGTTVCVSCPADRQPATRGPGSDDVETITTERQGESGSDVMDVKPRSLSEDGRRVFFKSYDSLAPGAIAGQRNFYEWEGGQTYLLMSGKGGGAFDPSEYLGASANGDDVMLRSSDKLVLQDFDNTTDVYDMRAPHVPGETVGFAAPPPPVLPCNPLAGECQGEPTPQPGEAGISASEVFSGPGNLPIPLEKRAQKKKPAKKKTPAHKGKPRHKRKPAHRKARKSHHKGAANNKGRTAR